MKTAQCLMGDRRAIAPYEGPDHVPYPLPAPLTAAELQPFVVRGGLVTFTVKVPLHEVAGVRDGTLAPFIQNTWLAGFTMENTAYRAVGASFNDFGAYLSGEVHVQVVCLLASPFQD